ncbi:MAG TPA: cyclic nucleotide-binding domain-containing protein [Opitutaceae bacterium]|nr:cyclic nucleotide-binding domain-containing protein [Opitutaceae bacterium]HND61803.1 cyclic nucleotide-binding domain-containing protein [Opitutaceae bacterium]
MSRSATAPGLQRPRRWDSPFAEDVSEADIARLLRLAPFRDMNPESFPRSAPLADILRNDGRLRTCQDGEIIVRQGDYGTSAFMVLSGSAQVVLSPDLPPSVVGRREPAKRGFFKALSQLWGNAREAEVDRGADQRKRGGEEQHIFLQDIPVILNRHRTATIEAGSFFGEIAALSRMPRTSTIFARGPRTELFEIRWQGLRDLMRYDPQLRKYIDDIYRERALSTYLAEIPFMQYLSEEAKQAVMAATQFETYGDYDWSGEYKKLAQAGTAAVAKEQVVASEGDYPNSVVMIRAGFARITQRVGDGHRTLNYLGSGRIYGFDEIAHNWRQPERPVPLQYTLRVLGYTHVLVIPAAVIEEHVLPALPTNRLPSLIEADSQDTSSPFALPSVQRPAAAEPAISADLMEFLTENRLFNGTETMVIDLDRCTRCDDCVRACASTHDNNPRFLRHGPVHANVMVAQACMHCADPVCMVGCPTGAIHRDAFEGEVVINPATCIGCTTCATNCPYESIRMVEQRAPTGEILVAADARPIFKATKCDLCIDQYGGPACVRACPHDALERVNLNTLDDLVGWLRR